MAQTEIWTLGLQVQVINNNSKYHGQSGRIVRIMRMMLELGLLDGSTIRVYKRSVKPLDEVLDESDLTDDESDDPPTPIKNKVKPVTSSVRPKSPPKTEFPMKATLDHFAFVIGTTIASNPGTTAAELDQIATYIGIRVKEFALEQRPELKAAN